VTYKISTAILCILFLVGCNIEGNATDANIKVNPTDANIKENPTGENLPLENIEWHLTSYGFKMGEKNDIVIDSQYSLVFDGASGVSGTFDCNGFRSTYTADKQTLSIQGLVTTKMGCVHVDNIKFQSQHELIHNALMAIQTYSISGSTLTIDSLDSTQLFYSAVVQ
jgi:heat shock protein HslJ